MPEPHRDHRRFVGRELLCKAQSEKWIASLAEADPPSRLRVLVNRGHRVMLRDLSKSRRTRQDELQRLARNLRFDGSEHEPIGAAGDAIARQTLVLKNIQAERSPYALTRLERHSVCLIVKIRT